MKQIVCVCVCLSVYNILNMKIHIDQQNEDILGALHKFKGLFEG